MRQLLIHIIFISLSISALSQGDFRKGFIITNTNDTIHGYIDYLNANLSSKDCYFKATLENDAIHFQPKDIIGYGFDQGKFYMSKTVDTFNRPKSFFLEYIIDGIVDLYFLREGNMDYLFVEKDSVIRVLSNNEVQLEINGKIYMKNSEQYIMILRYFMSDADDFSDRVRKTKFNNNSLIDLAVDYNNVMCDKDNPCIEYYKKDRLGTTSKWVRNLGVSLEVMNTNIDLKAKNEDFFGEYKNIITNAEFDDKAYGFSFPGLYLNMNRNGRFSFQPGIKYSYLNSSHLSMNEISLPFTIGLDIIKNKKTIPFVEFGVSPSFIWINNKETYFIQYDENKITDHNPEYITKYAELNDVIPNKTGSVSIFFVLGTKLNLSNGDILKLNFIYSFSVIGTSQAYSIGPYEGSIIKRNIYSLGIYYSFYNF